MQKNRRQSGRIDFGGASCELGTIVNISAGGMVVQNKYAPDRSRCDVTIGEHGEALRLSVEHVWTQRLRFRKFQVAYRFVDPPPDLMKKLCGVKLSDTIPRVI